MIGASDLTTFLTLVYGPIAGCVAGFSGVRPHPGAKRLTDRRTAFFHWPVAAPSVEAWVSQATRQAGREVYLAVRLFGAPHRRKDDPTPVRTLFVDGDGAVVPAALPPPTATLQTSPGKHHYLYVLSVPVAPADAQLLSTRLAHAIGADPSGADLTQLMRLPGTVNWKYDPPPQVMLTAITDRRHDPADLDRHLPLRPSLERPDDGRLHPATMPIRAGGGPPIRLRGYALAVWHGRHPVPNDDGAVDRSASLWPIAKDLARAGASLPLIAAALAERDQALGYRKAADRRDGGAWYWGMAEHAAATVASEAAVCRAESDCPTISCRRWPGGPLPRSPTADQTLGRPGHCLRERVPDAATWPVTNTPPLPVTAASVSMAEPPGQPIRRSVNGKSERSERGDLMYTRSLSRLILVGHVGRDAELRFLPSGTPAATFSVAVNRPTRDAEGNRAETVDWFRVTAWEALAERCGELLRTGARVLVDGRMESRRYTDRDGIERTAWEVRAFDVQIIDSPRDPTAPTDADEPTPEPPPLATESPPVTAVRPSTPLGTPSAAHPTAGRPPMARRPGPPPGL